MLLTGEFVDAEQAAAWGLVNRCVDDNCLMQEVQSLADQLASKSPATRWRPENGCCGNYGKGRGIRLMQLTNWPQATWRATCSRAMPRRALTLSSPSGQCRLERPMSIIDRNVPPPQEAWDPREWSRQAAGGNAIA